jgi:hypothetical protein
MPGKFFSKILAAALTIMMITGHSAATDTVPDGVRSALQGVISGQIQAFRTDRVISPIVLPRPPSNECFRTLTGS